MRDVKKKLILANVVIEEYQDWQKTTKKFPEEKVFDGFSTTLLMKLLYLSCLYSIRGSDKTYKDTPFGILDNWIALPNGPAEDDIYSVIGYQYMPTISYDLRKPDSKKYSKLKYEESIVKKLNNYYYENAPDAPIKVDDNPKDVLEKLILNKGLVKEAQQIRNGFNILKNNSVGTEIDVSTDEKNNRTINFLSKLSHLFLWDAALYRDARTLATDNIYLLKDELGELKRIQQRIKPSN